jgi:hypothetical protein
LLAQDTPTANPFPIYVPFVFSQTAPPDEPEVPDPPEDPSPGDPGAVALPDLIFADGFESGLLNKWSSATTDGGDLAAKPESAIAGSQGLRVVLDDNNRIYVSDARPAAERRLRVRFHVDPNSVAMGENESVVLFSGNSQGNARLVQVELRRASGQYWLRAAVLADTNSFVNSDYVAVSNEAHAVEFDWRASDNSTSVNGGLTLWIDGEQKFDVNGIDNNWRPVERVRLGAVFGIKSGTRGTLFLDSYESRRQTYIGPGELPGGLAPTPTPTNTLVGAATATPNNTLAPTNTPPAGATATPTIAPTAVPTTAPSPTPTSTPVAGDVPLVFVQRQIPNEGSIYWDVPKDMPGVGPHSRFRVASPGKLLVLETNGRIRVLVDGSQPTAASLNLIDVNAPDVSYDGTTIVFAGLPQGNYDRGPAGNPGAWRIYAIRSDGTGLRQITRSDQNLNYAQFGNAEGGLQGYDDTDPAWLPDGRIVFSSTRWPAFGHYSGVRVSNLFVVNGEGSALHRITSERNGADRPMVDPITGKIVYARWWRNHRFALDSMATVTNPNGGYSQNLGLTIDRGNHVGGGDFLWRNQWHLATINPDGTGLAQWGGTHHKQDSSHSYGGAFLSNGDVMANYYPMANMTEAGGFGGLRLYRRGPFNYTPVIGITYVTLNYVSPSNPTSFGIFNGNYASDPAQLPNGKVAISWARDIGQDYGLYTINRDGSGLSLLYDNAGTTELRAKPLTARPLPPILPDTVSQAGSLLPPTAAGPYTGDGVFTFSALNVYANGPVDTEIAPAPPVGSAAMIRFFTDFQRTSPGSFPNLDWPILLAEIGVNADGSVVNAAAPANIPLFEQLRTSAGTVPLVPGSAGTAAHVAGMNFGKPGEVQRCVGCHAGHTMITVPANDADAKFSNVAPSAQVSVSSSRDANQDRGLVDRRVQTGEIWRYWNSASGQTTGQWVQLTFPVPVTVRKIVLYNPRQGGEANSTIQVQGTNIRLYSDAGATQQVGVQTTGALAVSGTAVNFADVRARVVRVEITGVTGTFYGSQLASIAEVEVVARAEAP